MLFANDKEGNRVYIDFAVKGVEYFCPICGNKMILKMGDVRIHHFSHAINSICKDTWHYDMTLWHYNWQNKFPKECQEVVKTSDGNKHRADVLIEDKKIVFEFQHSPISEYQFMERNRFFNNLGYKVIWIFDIQKQYIEGVVEETEKGWKWSRAFSTFNGFNCKNKDVVVYLQLDDDEVDGCSLVKVIWSTCDRGFSRFYTDEKYYDENDILDLAGLRPKGKEEYVLSDLYDDLLECGKSDHSVIFWGCTLSPIKKCVFSDIDYNGNGDIKCCMTCGYNQENMYGGCKKRFIDLGMSSDTVVKIVSRDKNNFINRLSYIKEGTIEFINVPTIDDKLGSTVFELWKQHASELLICKNIRTGYYIKINEDPNQHIKKYGRVYGRISKNTSNFPSKTCELYNVYNSEWVYEYSR